MPYRFLTGGGLRLNIKQKEKLKLHAGVGVMIESERWKSLENDSPDIEKNILKNSSYLSGKLILSEHDKIDLIGYFQGGHDTDSDLFRSRLSADAILNVKVTKRLAFVTNFAIQYEDRPIIPINNLVYSLTNGLKWNF